MILNNHKVKWIHLNKQSEKTIKAHPEVADLKQSQTHCEILTLRPEEKVVCSSVALLHHKDNYSKAIGRKRSFGKALICIPREERKAFWDAYIAQFPNDQP